MSWTLDREQLNKARERGNQEASEVISATYNRLKNTIDITYHNRSRFSVPANLIQGLELATPDQIAQLELSPLRDVLSWDDLDVDVSIEGLRNEIFGTSSYMAELAKRGGKVTSEAKAEAARNNGKLGGRPPSRTKIFWARLNAVGVTKALVMERFLPRDLAQEVEAAKTSLAKEDLLTRISQYVQKIYHWNLDQILGTGELVRPAVAAASARFKMPGNVNEEKASAYVVYAHYLALLAVQAAESLPKRTLEEDSQKLIEILQRKYGGITLETTLQYLWDCGVVTFSLSDSGSFHGACWRIDGRNVIALKQKTESEFRTLFDLLHELDHIAEDQESQDFVYLELSETSDERRNSEQEHKASLYAGEVSLNGRAEELTQLCVDQARGSVEGLKSAVQLVAMRENVSVSALANYVAFRLHLTNGINWWGAANNLQTKGNPRKVINDLFFGQIDLEKLNPIDRDMLVRGISG